MVAVRWYLRHGLSDRDVEELLVERGVEIDHVTVYRRVQRFTPLHAIALIKSRWPLQRFTGRRDPLPDIIRSVAGLAADRAAKW